MNNGNTVFIGENSLPVTVNLISHWEKQQELPFFIGENSKKSEKLFGDTDYLSFIFETVITIPINIQNKKSHGN